MLTGIKLTTHPNQFVFPNNFCHIPPNVGRGVCAHQPPEPVMAPRRTIARVLAGRSLTNAPWRRTLAMFRHDNYLQAWTMICKPEGRTDE
jgi:hypothetical protein